MIRNRLLTLAEWFVGYGSYPFSLVAWAVGCYKGSRRLFSILWWLEGHRIAKCRECDFEVRWGWNFCPNCGDGVQGTLLEELSE